MIPSIKLEKMYRNGTTFTISDNTCDVLITPDKLILNVGFFNKSKTSIILDSNSYITPKQFIDGSSLLINSKELNVTNPDSKLLEIESGIIEFNYYIFYDKYITVEVNSNKIILNFPAYTIVSYYDYILINNIVYSINKYQSYNNIIVLNEDTKMVGEIELYVGCMGINYIVHTIQINKRLTAMIGLSINADCNKDACNDDCTKENKLVNYLLLYDSINTLKDNNDLPKLNYVINTLKSYLYILPDKINKDSNYVSNSCRICN
jgi:hypothetical protein